MADELKESEGGHFTGLHCGPRGADERGELELVLTVDGHEGSIWISQEFWIALVKAGWVAPIFTEDDYKRAMHEITELMEAGPAEGTPGAMRLEALAGAAEQYEKAHFPIPRQHPGDTIAEYLESKNWTETDLVQHTGLGAELVAKLCSGESPITPEVAARLAVAFDRPESFWLNLQQQYDRAKP